MISGKKTNIGIPVELDPILRMGYTFLTLGGSLKHMEEIYHDSAEWQRFKASSFYPDRFDDWSDERMKELGFENYDGPRYE